MHASLAALCTVLLVGCGGKTGVDDSSGADASAEAASDGGAPVACPFAANGVSEGSPCSVEGAACHYACHQAAGAWASRLFDATCRAGTWRLGNEDTCPEFF